MWEKVKRIFAVIGAVFTVAVCTFVLVFLRRRDSDGQRSGRTVVGDTSVEDGITDSQGKLAECSDGVSRCEDHLQRAEDILRNAIRRSREETGKSENGVDNNDDN